MFSRRLTSDSHPRSKNGNPPQRTTGAASANSIQTSPLPPSHEGSEKPGIISAIESSRSGMVSARQIQNLRVMSEQFGIGGFLLGQHGDRLQGHPADRTWTRTIADDLRMHGARILVPGGRNRSVTERSLSSASVRG